MNFKVGMSVAHLQGNSKKEISNHAVDNLGDPFGFVADWPALKRWWQSYPPTARGGRSGFGHQPDYW